MRWAEWHDACYNAGQYRPDEFEPVCLLRSAGVLVKETATHLCFSQDFYPVEGTYRHITSVPKGMIVSLQRLTVSLPKI